MCLKTWIILLNFSLEVHCFVFHMLGIYNFVGGCMLGVIYQTRGTVFHRGIQTPRRELKMLCAAEYFWRNLRCLDSRWNTVSSHREPSHPFKILNKRSNYRYHACFVFCGGHFEFLICVHCKLCSLLVWSLEPRLQKSGICKFLGGFDHSLKIIVIRLLTFSSHVSASWGHGNKMWRRDRKSKCGFLDACTQRCNKVDLLASF